MDTISVVIPVYNSARYLRECVDSILGQTYGNLDVILVDDGSTDESPQICQSYALRDSRVRYYTSESNSVGAARNDGIDRACGKYLMFVDSDDVCEAELAERLMAAHEQEEGNGDPEQNRLTMCGIRVTDENGQETGAFQEQDSRGSVWDYLRNVLSRWQSNPLCGGVYCKLFETERLRENGIRFEEHETYAEDFLFNLAYLKHVKHVEILSDLLYRYRMGRPGSLTEKNRQKADPEAIWKRRKQVIGAFEDVYRTYGLETECAEAIRIFRLKNVTDIVEMAVRQSLNRKDFIRWMTPLREETGKGFTGMPRKYRITLELLSRGRYGLLYGYETARRRVRRIRGRER